MTSGKWQVWRVRRRTGRIVWIALAPPGGPFDMRPFDTHAEALAYVIEQAEAGL